MVICRFWLPTREMRQLLVLQVLSLHHSHFVHVLKIMLVTMRTHYLLPSDPHAEAGSLSQALPICDLPSFVHHLPGLPTGACEINTF